MYFGFIWFETFPKMMQNLYRQEVHLGAICCLLLQRMKYSCILLF